MWGWEKVRDEKLPVIQTHYSNNKLYSDMKAHIYLHDYPKGVFVYYDFFSKNSVVLSIENYSRIK